MTDPDPRVPGGSPGQAVQGRRAQPLLAAKASPRTQKCAVPGGSSGRAGVGSRSSQQVSVFGKALCAVIVALGAFAATASAAVPHTVAPGETLWSIAAANNFTTQTLAAYNGLSADAQVYAGETIQIPTGAEGASALASSGTTSTATSTSSGVTHTVQPGESLSSVAAANGVSVDTLAADNGLSSDALLIAGQQITIPSSAVSAATTTSATPTATASPPPEEHPSWTSPIYCPSCPNGEAYLASNAAYNWNAMRQASLDTYGIDLYPAGPLSGYRSYAEQLYLYDLYLSGQGSLAAAPGTSSHEYGAALDLADPSMANVIDQIGATYGWVKTEASSEWWHVNYVGP
jgi:LysM repeat protein